MLRLAGLANDHWWQIDGFAVSRNMPPLAEMAVDRFCSFVRWFFLREADSTEVAKFEAQVWRPPKGVAPAKSSPWSAEAETAAFQALKAGIGKRE